MPPEDQVSMYTQFLKVLNTKITDFLRANGTLDKGRVAEAIPSSDGIDTMILMYYYGIDVGFHIVS